MNSLDPAIRRRFETAIAIPVMPFESDYELDEEAYARIIGGMASHGITAMAANGNVSEFYSLTSDEVTRAVAATRAAAGPDVEVIAGVGRDLRSAVSMARSARDSGASAIMVHQPENPFTSREGWIEYHLEIASAVPDTDLVIYVRDPRIRPADLKALADACPTLAAIKYTLPDVFGFADAVDRVGRDRVAWVCGLTETWTPFFWLSGARGFTSGIANFAPTLVVEFLDLLRTGDDEATMTAWSTLRPLERLRTLEHAQYSVAVVKEALNQAGVADRRVRPPLSVLPEDSRAAVAEIVNQWKLNDRIAAVR